MADITQIKVGGTTYDIKDPTKLPKVTYEWNKEFAAAQNGAISLGRYNMYDSHLTFDITSTTTQSLSGKLVIATQNGSICQARVFGDATGTLASKLIIYQSALSNSRSWVEVFCNFDGWSKNKVHIYAVALNSATVEKQMTSVTISNGVPATANVTSGDTKWSGAIINDLAATFAAKSHSHDVSIATSSGTNELTLAHGTKYALTTGGQSFVFTTPSDSNTHNSHAVISGKKSDGTTDIKGSASSGDITLGDSGVTAGTYKRVTVNSKGIVVGGDNTDADTNTSHSHSAGVGLVGSGSAGTSGGTYDYKAKLRSETALTIDSAAATTTSGRVYPVAVDKSGYLSVNVPWTDTDTNTTYSAGTGLQLSGTTFSAKLNSTTSLGTIGTTSKLYAVGVDANGKLCVNVPWTDTNTDTDTHYTKYLQIKGNGTEAVKFTQNADKSLNLKPGTNVSISAASGEITINATDTTYSLVGAKDTTGLVKNGSSVTSTSGLTACPIISGVPYYKDTNTTYSSKTAASGGTDVSLVTTGEKYTWNNKTTLAEVEDYIEENSEEVDLGTYFTKSDVSALFNELFSFSGTTLIIKDQ